jgi:Holliday junction resolvase
MTYTNYDRGKNFEYRVMRYLRDNGFLVMRQAKSSFPDIYAVRKSTGKKICVECKVRGYLSEDEKVGLTRIWVYYDIHPFVARRDGKKMIFHDFLFNEDVKAV